RQIFRQRLPLASRPQDVEDSIQHLAHVHRPFAPTMSRWRDHGLYDRPFGIGQITGVTKATAVRRKAVFGCPHRALLKRESSARQGITSDSSDSRTSRIGSETADLDRVLINAQIAAPLFPNCFYPILVRQPS